MFASIAQLPNSTRASKLFLRRANQTNVDNQLHQSNTHKNSASLMLNSSIQTAFSRIDQLQRNFDIQFQQLETRLNKETSWLNASIQNLSSRANAVNERLDNVTWTWSVSIDVVSTKATTASQWQETMERQLRQVINTLSTVDTQLRQLSTRLDGATSSMQAVSSKAIARCRVCFDGSSQCQGNRHSCSPLV